MFPYIDTTRWPFNPFATLVAVALGVGYWIASARAKAYGIDPERFAKLGLCVIGCAFLGGHIAKFIYSPGSWRLLLFNPSMMLRVLNGQASFGAFLGGFAGAVVFLWSGKTPYRDQFLYADAACFAVPFSWWIGRVGCYLAHDHPGIRTTSLLGVRYPGGTRYDLGLLEALFLLSFSAVLWTLDRRPRPRGFYYVAFLLGYGTFRVLQDQLHVDPPRYGGWSVDEIAGTVMIAAGILTILDLKRLARQIQLGQAL